MRKLIECVPNISEGRDIKKIEEIASAAASVDGVRLLGVDPGADTNRSVITFVGEPAPVLEAAFRLIKKAKELIDMRGHSGAHPRMGAVDVCPLVPVSGIELTECAKLAGELASRAGELLGIPVYLYGAAALRPQRRRLPDIREGEYEALEEKIQGPDFAPDFGPAVFLPGYGATAIGARDFLLAYNVNLNTPNVSLARDIALTVRESGRAKRDSRGEIIRNSDGKPVKVPGLLKACQAAGWYIDEYGYAQVTMNLANYHESGLHHAFEAVEQEARKRGLRVTGSELIGLLPIEAVLDAGIHYLKKAGLNTGIPQKDIISTAVRSLGLNDTAVFEPEEKIVELAVMGPRNQLSDLSCRDFCDELSSSSMAPGGGSASALALSLSAGLTSMVANITHGKKSYSRNRTLMTDLSTRSQQLKDRALELIDEDADAFNAYIAALKAKDGAAAGAAKRMTEIPLETLRAAAEAASLAEAALRRGLRSACSDSGSALSQAGAAAEGAYLNVMINLADISDSGFTAPVRLEADELLEKTRAVCRRGLKYAIRMISDDS